MVDTPKAESGGGPLTPRSADELAAMAKYSAALLAELDSRRSSFVNHLEAEIHNQLQAAFALGVAEARQEWQPMETVPKDGTPFLVHWGQPGTYPIEMVSGWAEYAEIIAYGEPAATHWMRLPDPLPTTALRQGPEPQP